MKIDRLLAITTILLQREQITAPELAKRFEVSKRTIGRDIDDLCKAGIPVITRQGSGGGISIDEGYKLDKSILTSDELQNMIVALRGLNSVSDNSQIEKLLDKLAVKQNSIVAMGERIVIDLSSNYKNSLSEKIGTIKSAINETKLIRFDYYYEKGHTERTIEPYFIAFKWSSWYVFGYCNKKEDFRLFKLNRLWNLSICKDIYYPREIPADRVNLEAFHTDQNKVVVLFHKSVEYRLIEEYGLDCFVEMPDGMLRFERGYTNRDYMISWILGFGNRAEVVEPEDLRREIGEIVKNMSEFYE